MKIHCAVHLFLPRLMSGKSWMAPSWFFHQTDERWIKAHSLGSAAPLPREEDLNSFGAGAAIDSIAEQPQKRIDRETDSAGRRGEEEGWRLRGGRKRLPVLQKNTQPATLHLHSQAHCTFVHLSFSKRIQMSPAAFTSSSPPDFHLLLVLAAVQRASPPRIPTPTPTHLSTAPPSSKAAGLRRTFPLD